MAKFQIYGSDGKKYEVESDTMDSAMELLDQHLGGNNNKQPLQNTETFGRLAVSPQRLAALAKGIPGLGQFVPETNLQQSDPITNKTLNITGNTMAMAAPVAKVSSGLAGAGLPGLLSEIGGQSALGVGTNIGDKVAEKGFNTSREDLRNSTVMGMLQGTVGPLLGKAISPSFNSNRWTVEQLAEHPEQHLERVLRPSAARETAAAVLNHPLVSGVGGAALSALTGAVHPVLGALAGAAAPAAFRGAHRIIANKAMHDVDTQAILNALSQTTGQQINK